MEGEQKTSALVFATPLAALVIGAAIGFIIGAGQGRGEVAKLQAQIDAAKKFFPSIPEMRSIGGVVKSVSGNTITLETTMMGNPFENLPTERTVTIAANTKVVELLQKDQATFQKEMEEYSKKMSAIRPGDAPVSVAVPLPFAEKEITVNNLKAGATISVEANENIKEKSAFTAVKVVVSSMAMPTMVPPSQVR